MNDETCTNCGRRIRYDRKTAGCYLGECATHTGGVVPQGHATPTHDSELHQLLTNRSTSAVAFRETEPRQRGT